MRNEQGDDLLTNLELHSIVVVTVCCKRIPTATV